MCATCGCSEEGGTRSPASRDPGAGHHYDTARLHTHTITLEQQLLSKNDLLAARTRSRLDNSGVTAFNMMSSPGAGKTTLLERTIDDLQSTTPVAVVEGDQETSLDAERIARTGCAVVQVNTGSGCHLDARMTEAALDTLDLNPGTVVFVENVGNLVCPALFDLGEHAKVVLISTPEGADKPLKYPHIFSVADLVIVNKSDLTPYVDFDLETCWRNARSVNPHVELIALSATTGDGVDTWYDWIGAQADAHRTTG